MLRKLEAWLGYGTRHEEREADLTLNKAPRCGVAGIFLVL